MADESVPYVCPVVRSELRPAVPTRVAEFAGLGANASAA